MTIPRNTDRKKGFSLVEMSVVLSIIALLIGGVLVGRNMIRTADIQGTLAMAERYAGALRKFQDRFYALPGDMPNATDMWGAADASASCASPSGTTGGDGMASGSGTQTCDGNGDGRIGGSNVSASGCLGNLWETYRMWQHLSNAGLIEGAFTGTRASGSSSFHTTVGTNVPRAPLSTGGYSVVYCGGITSIWSYFNGNYGHIMQIGSALSATPFGFTYGALFTPGEAGEIDKKLDDSYADTGNILGIQSDDASAPNCTNNASATPVSGGSDYRYTNGAQACPLIMKLGF